MNRNHTGLYETLNIKTNASDDEIRRAYKKLAIKYHPDKNKDASAEDMFKKISYAYEILSNAEKKQIYDQFGEEGLKSGMADDFDPMTDFFRMHRETQQKPTAQMKHTISLEEYFMKKPITITIPRNLRCESCDATGFTDKTVHYCKTCNGRGLVVQTVRQGHIIHQMQQVCGVCEGKKIDTRSVNLKCQHCNMKGTIKTEEKIEVDLPYDIINRPHTIIYGKGPWLENKYIDLVVNFKLKMSKGFTLTSDSKLIYTMRINYTETMCGFKRVLSHPSNVDFLIIAEEGYIINPDSIYIFDKLGLNNDIMYLSFVISYPEKIVLPKKKLLSFKTLETTLGDRHVPNIQDGTTDPDDIYVLSTLSKINNNPRSKESAEKDLSDDSPTDKAHGIGGCSQQ